MKTGSGAALIRNGRLVDGDMPTDISILEDRQPFIAVVQGGIVKAGQLAHRG